MAGSCLLTTDLRTPSPRGPQAETHEACVRVWSEPSLPRWWPRASCSPASGHCFLWLGRLERDCVLDRPTPGDLGVLIQGCEGGVLWLPPAGSQPPRPWPGLLSQQVAALAGGPPGTQRGTQRGPGFLHCLDPWERPQNELRLPAMPCL